MRGVPTGRLAFFRPTLYTCAMEHASTAATEPDGARAPTLQPPEPGTLYVVATPIGHLGDLSPRAAHFLRTCDLVACEDTRVTRGLLAHAGSHRPVISYHDHREKQQAA